MNQPSTLPTLRCPLYSLAAPKSLHSTFLRGATSRTVLDRHWDMSYFLRRRKDDIGWNISFVPGCFVLTQKLPLKKKMGDWILDVLAIVGLVFGLSLGTGHLFCRFVDQARPHISFFPSAAPKPTHVQPGTTTAQQNRLHWPTLGHWALRLATFH